MRHSAAMRQRMRFEERWDFYKIKYEIKVEKAGMINVCFFAYIKKKKRGV